MVLGSSLLTVGDAGGPTLVSMTRNFVPQSVQAAATGTLYTLEEDEESTVRVGRGQGGGGSSCVLGYAERRCCALLLSCSHSQSPACNLPPSTSNTPPQYYLLPRLPPGEPETLYFSGQLEEITPPAPTPSAGQHGGGGGGGGGDLECVAMFDPATGQWTLEKITYKLAMRCAIGFALVGSCNACLTFSVGGLEHASFSNAPCPSALTTPSQVAAGGSTRI